MAYNTELEQLIELHTASNKQLEKKELPYSTGYLLDGKMCFGVYENYLVVRTTENNFRLLTEKKGFSAFKVNGITKKGWLQAAPIIYRNPKLLRKLLEEGIRCTQALVNK